VLKSLHASRLLVSKPRGRTLRKRQRNLYVSRSKIANKPKLNIEGCSKVVSSFILFKIVERTASRLKG